MAKMKQGGARARPNDERNNHEQQIEAVKQFVKETLTGWRQN
jgi:hypothetical protein